MIRRLILSVIGLALCSVPLTAQVPVTYGARLSMDVSFPGGNSNPYKIGAGFSAGAVAKIGLPKQFFVEPGIMFNFTSMTAKNLTSFDDKYFYQGAARIYGIRVPVNVGYTVPVGSQLDMDIATGPYINYNISAQQNFSPNLSAPVPVPDANINLFKNGWKRVDTGWNISLGLTFAKSYYVGVGGGVSLSPLASFGVKDKKVRIHRSSVSVVLGYNF